MLPAARLLLIASLALLPLRAGAAGDNGDIAVQVEKVGETIRVKVECPVNVPHAVAWDVMTDYDNMAKYVSNLQQSVIRMRLGNRMQVEQKGKASRGPLSISFENVREVELVPQTEIRSKLIKGDTMPAQFTTRIEDREGGVRVLHTGTYTPSMWVPPGIGTMLIEQETRKQYGELRDEMLRRASGGAK